MVVHDLVWGVTFQELINAITLESEKLLYQLAQEDGLEKTEPTVLRNLAQWGRLGNWSMWLGLLDSESVVGCLVTTLDHEDDGGEVQVIDPAEAFKRANETKQQLRLNLTFRLLAIPRMTK